jgi:hypothetical protein
MKISKENDSDTINLAWKAVNFVVNKYGCKHSIIFADENNFCEHKYQVMHRVIFSLGGYHSISKNLCENKFKDKFVDVWNNFNDYQAADRCVGLNEYINGSCTRVINAKTGKNVFSDGTSI